MKNETKTIRCRIDGTLHGIHGPLTDSAVNRDIIAGTMDWGYYDEAAETFRGLGKLEGVIADTLSLLAEGKSVQLYSEAGYAIFQPLAEGEDGTQIPASRSAVFLPDGTLVERTVS